MHIPEGVLLLEGAAVEGDMVAGGWPPTDDCGEWGGPGCLEPT